MLNVVKGRGKISCRKEMAHFYVCNGAYQSSKTHQNNSIDRCKFARGEEGFSLSIQGVENTRPPA